MLERRNDMDMELARKVTLRSELRELDQEIKAHEKAKKKARMFELIAEILIYGSALTLCILAIAKLNIQLMQMK